MQKNKDLTCCHLKRFVHKYIGTYTDDTSASTGSGDLYIQDVLFLENRDRKYDTDIYELRGAYNIADPDFDLTQFGMFVNNDSLFMTFHMNTCASLLGRRLMAGDVVELPHLRDDLLLGGGEAINRYFLRTDFEPHRLFKKQGSRMIKVSDDNKKAWSAANRILTSFINNDSITTNTDGTTQSEKTNLSKAVKPKADN